MINHLPMSLDLRVTGRCNLNCNFCFGASSCIKDMNVEKWFSLLEKFWERRVRCLVITGGEPTIYLGILELLRFAKNKGFFIVLSSNGISNNFYEIFNYIDSLSLPIDGKNYEQCAKMRRITLEQYNNVKQMATLFKLKYPSKTLKIGTVITSENCDDIEEIYDNVSGFADVWKLYQVSRRKRNEKIFNEIMVSDEKFQYISNKYAFLNNAEKPKVVFCCDNLDGKYLFCEPNGDAMVIYKGEELKLGNFISDFDKICEIWQDYVSLDALEQNVANTYLYQESTNN